MMKSNHYDLVLVGGGLAGAALAISMARRGARALVIEREEAFKDRVRGEGMPPWGAAEARTLGIYELLLDACGYETRFWDTSFGPALMRRDLLETTPQRAPVLSFHHPVMQETLIRAAADAGASVRRGASVTAVTPGAPPSVVVEQDGKTEVITARMVIGADGRSSRVRSWAGFEVRRDPPRLFIGGVLLEGARAPMEAVSLIQTVGQSAVFFPQRGGRVRAYVVYHRDRLDERLTGHGDLPRFIAMAAQSGVPAEWLAEARAAGPLATFEGADTWVPHPYRDGVALIGDAAASSDPSWGQGLALTLRDVRVLDGALARGDDWESAGHAYAEEHDRYYEALHTVEDWYTKLFMELGPAADERRGRALPLIAADPTRVPDVLFSGPNHPLGDEDRARFIGE